MKGWNILLFLFCFLCAFLSSFLIKMAAVRFDIIDHPGGRKIHKKATPLLGGLAIYAGVLSGMFLAWQDVSGLFPVLCASTAVLIMGLIDDIRGLSAKFRLWFEVFIVLILIKFGVCVSFLPAGLWGDLGEILVTLLWIVGVTNACNYLDGLDGLACGSAVINLSFFGVILYSTNQRPLVFFILILLFSVSGFMPHNFRKAKMFLGDSGSAFLGFTIACIAVLGNWAEDNIVKLSIPVLILGVPIFDMIFTTITRVKEEKVKTLTQWLRYAGRDHFHHYLVDLGLLPQGAVFFIYFITISLGISALMLSDDKAYEAVLSLGQASIVFLIIATLIVVGKRRRSGWNIAARKTEDA